jgi:hypothetical protein
MLETWVNDATMVQLGLVVFVGMIAASLAGYVAHRWAQRFKAPKGAEDDKADEKSSELVGYVISTVLGLLALLLGFTYAMAVDRYETRRAVVLEEARAIDSAYLHAQLLEDPHRTRLSRILVNYAENRLVLATAPPADVPPLLARSDALLVDLGAATAAAFDSVRTIDFSSALVDSMQNVIGTDAARKAARLARVPTQVYAMLFLYMCITAFVLGYILVTFRHLIAATMLYILLTLAVLLIFDIDRPTTGTVKEAQGPMERLVASLKHRPTGTYDRWRIVPRPSETGRGLNS